MRAFPNFACTGRPRQRPETRQRQAGLLNCPVCASDELEYAFVVDKYPVCQCQSCSLLFLNPQPPRPSSIAGTTGRAKSSALDARLIFDRLLSYSTIEVRNVLLLQAGQPFLEQEAFSRGLRITSVTVPDLAFMTEDPTKNVFDACILYGSLERTAGPENALVAIRRLLKPGASLVINAASVDSVAARQLRNRWWEFSSDSYFYFGVNTIQNLLLKTGFREPLVYAGDIDRFRAGLGRISGRVIGERILRSAESRLTILVRPGDSSVTPKLSIIVPAYNEKATFSELIEAVLAKRIENVDIEVIIVESNSTDGTRDDVLRCREDPRVQVILEDRPRGKGHAVRAGLQRATGDVILIQDADLEYDINEYESLIGPILNYEQNFVIGSRHVGFGQTWKIRRFTKSPVLAHVFNFGHLFFLALFNRIYRQRLADPFSMFKVFRRDCLYGLDFECNRFDFDFEIVIKLIRKGYKPIEIPINYQSRSVTEGKKVTLVRDPLTWLRALVRFRTSPLYRTTSARGRGAE